ncbi:putative U-box domain-containing protein 42 [Diospyros lotus]|uniref:putative U-box domain-containing protein 42 n=1 Tax=Diospyros lotus TaxID=55363 RepID=UPI00225BB9F6|nr:putative U-box domain-containing protein 42 [Diospyros lotus]
MTNKLSLSHQLEQDKPVIRSLAASLLVSISEITALVASIEVEQHTFVEFGSCLYRASVVVMELQASDNASTNSREILQSLSKTIGFAKEVVEECKKGAHSSLNHEVRSTIGQLQRVVNCIGKELGLIPSSTFGDQRFAEIAVCALSKEMKNLHFEFALNQLSEEKELEPLVSKKEVVETETEAETDLYSIDQFSREINQLSDAANQNLLELFGSTNSSGQMNSESLTSGSLTTFPQLAQYMEPLYDTFCCPLTKKIMDDAVTIETGITYERKAIVEWYEKFKNPEDIICPKTGQKLQSRVLSTNMALKATIQQWKERNEVTRMKVARAALSLASTESMVLEALKDLHSICNGKQNNKVQVCSLGLVPLLVKFLEYKERKVRNATLELLLLLTEDDNNEGKKIVALAVNLSILINMLSSNHQPIRHKLLQLLLRLSSSQSECQKFGSVAGGILMLVSIKYKWSSDAFACELADDILKNLEKCPENIKLMAKNGLLEPLLNHLIEGNQEMKMEMASYLGEIVLGHEGKIQAAERACPALINMVQSGNSLTRKAAFKALKQISSHHPSSKVLVEAGTARIMFDEMFERTIYNEPMNSKTEAAAILANILESGLDLESSGQTMDLDYIVYNIVHLLKNSTPDELNINLFRILLCLTRSPKMASTMVPVIKETEASYNLVELINNPNEEVAVSAIKLLVALSPYMGHTLADRLCKIRGLPETLIQTETTRITEKHALSANLLAKLPHQNLALNLNLLNKNTVPLILQAIGRIQRSGLRTSRYAIAYLEGLVGILVRFTTTLYDHQVLSLAKGYNFTAIFADLLAMTSSDEVQRLAAVGLANLSTLSITLSKPPQANKPKSKKLMASLKRSSLNSSKYSHRQPVCRVHRGDCSSEETFCLLEAKAVEQLLDCLEHENGDVVEAALSAIITLLDEKVDVESSVSVLREANGIGRVVNVVKEHEEERLWQKSLWVIERVLMNSGDRSSASEISGDRVLPAVLITAFRHRNERIRQLAENILRYLNKVPDFTSITNFTL